MNILERAIDWTLGRIGTVNTTNLRIVMTLCLVAATAFVYLAMVVRVLVFGLKDPLTFATLANAMWEPSGSWLTFLAAMSGIDALTFAAKRATDKTYVAARQSGAMPQPEPGPGT